MEEIEHGQTINKETELEPVHEVVQQPTGVKAPSTFPVRATQAAQVASTELTVEQRLTTLEKNHANLEARLKKKIAYL